MNPLKRITALFIAVIIALSLCSCTNNTIRKDGEFNPDNYVSEAQLSIFINYVKLNQHFYNDVFVLDHLKIDESKAFTDDKGVKWAPVTDEMYKTYDSLVQALYGTYTEEAVKKILKDYPIYADVNGVFCYNTEDLNRERKGNKWLLNEDKEIELEGRTEDSFTLEFRFYCEKDDEIDEFTFVRTGNGINDGYRLTELHAVS